MQRFRNLISAVVLLAVLAGNLAAARTGCCQYGPLASQCCCHKPATPCPKCAEPKSCCASKAAKTSSPTTATVTRDCKCPKHAPVAAVVEPNVRAKDVLDFAAAHVLVTEALVIVPDVHLPIERGPPPVLTSHSLAVWHCSWQA